MFAVFLHPSHRQVAPHSSLRLPAEKEIDCCVGRSADGVVQEHPFSVNRYIGSSSLRDLPLGRASRRQRLSNSGM